MSEPNLLLLHGALGASSQFAPLIPLLEDDFELHTLDFEGHGGRDLASGSFETSPLPGHTFSMERFVRNVLDYLEHQSIKQTHIFGYSMGGYVACLANLQTPVRIIVGDRDNTVSIEESADLYRALPHGELEVLPGTRHEFEKVPVERLAQSLLNFLATRLPGE